MYVHSSVEWIHLQLEVVPSVAIGIVFFRETGTHICIAAHKGDVESRVIPEQACSGCLLYIAEL
jgi:hypothetical protein